ncbi:hypothetical protein [Porphyrobacter sp. YT40]|uniref:hypothetical protein n=1 Tax=Porphyrobacter sp. YT40 TaxID=2547601 RepID=UPI001142CA07|nr:hypothetical protein [Porphyrobacter sp. YT40]QDH35122.1 hypothetical protein E2E27_12795 [Porphyrobacter sp. YT40]
MADNDEKHIDNFDEYLPDEAEVEAWLKSEEFDGDGGDELVAAEPREANAHDDPNSSEEVSWDDDEEINPNKGLSFSTPAPVEGEVLVPYNQLQVWEHHPAATSRTRAAHFEALCASANDPCNIPPLEVIRTQNGYRIIDGRFRWLAIGVVHGATSKIGIRCLVFQGTEKQALEKLADSAVGGIPRSPIEQARAIYNLQLIAGDSQRAISERYPVLSKDQVSRMTIAARTVEQFSRVFNLLAEPDRVPIDTCVKLAQWVKAASEEMRAEMLKTAEALESEFLARSGSGDDKARLLKPTELFDALGIEIEKGGAKSKAKASADVEVSDVLESVDIFGEDDQPVGVVERLNERVMRITLPDPAAMSPDQREAAAQGYIRQILDYFGLEGAV